MSTPTPAQLRDSFQLAEIDTDSLSPWATVHRARTRDGSSVVVKRTAGHREGAEAMAAWTRELAHAQVATVTPMDLDVSNPRPIAPASADGPASGDADDADWWVVYPFIDGRPYTGSAADIDAAGDLLGRIHALPLPAGLDRSLRPYSWPETEREEVDDDLETLDAVFARHAGTRASEATVAVHALAERWWTRAMPVLREVDESSPLPRAGVTSDYKSGNLVYTGRGPVLVDPDNGGFEPRILDLALAGVLFHNECPTAPPRLLSTDEWRIFLHAYLRHVDLTEVERELWPLALDHMFWEEGTWVLEDNDAEAWTDPRQGAQLLDLALATPERYPLG